MRRLRSGRLSRSIAVIGATGALVAAAGVLIGGAPAGAVNNDPAGNPTSPALSYEADCTTALSAGEVAPFLTTLDGNTSVDTALPSGATFGFSGAASTTLVGAFIANLFANGVGTPTATLKWVETLSSTDGNATGTYAYTSPTISESDGGGTVSGASWTNGSTTLTGDFSSAAVGDAVASNAAGLDAQAVITAINGTTSATMSAPASADGTGTVGYGATTVYTDPTLSTGNVFTTAGTNGGTAGVGVTSVTSFTVGVALPLTFGGSPGTGTANCLETGWDASDNPGPAQTGASTPQFPPGTTTALVSTSPLQFEPAAYVNLVQPPPTASSLATTMGVDGTKTVTLPASPGPGQTITSCDLVGGSISDPRLAVSISNSPTTCQATLTDSGSGTATVTFQFTATDSYPLTSDPATVTVTIGTPPVDQQINQQVNGGVLELSCSAPGSGGYPSTTCPLITLPAITLNGSTQTTTAPANTIYVSDNRGDPTVGWSLTTYFVTTPGNSNSACTTVAAFCNSTAGSHASSPDGQITADNLSISTPACAPASGNLNPAPTAGTAGAYPTGPGALTLCTADAGSSGGTFTMETNFTLSIPASVYAGLYEGTVEYLVS